jgi:hypothetical protein
MSDIIKIEQQLGGKDYKYYDNLVSNLFTQAEVIMEDERNVDQKTHPYGKVKEIKNRKVDFSSTVIPYKPLIDETFEQFKNEFISLGYEFKEKPNLGGDDKTFPFMERANFRLYEIIKTKDRLFTETNNTLSLLDSGYNSVSLNNFRSTFSNDFKKWFEKVKEFIKLFGNLQEYVTSYIESAKARVKKEKEEENNPHVYNRDGYSTHTFSTLLPLQADLKTYVDIATAMTTRSYEIIDVTEKVIETLDKSFKG